MISLDDETGPSLSLISLPLYTFRLYSFICGLKEGIPSSWILECNLSDFLSLYCFPFRRSLSSTFSLSSYTRSASAREY